MKPFLFAIIFTTLLFAQPTFGQFLDTPGFVNRLPIKTDGNVFEVHVVSNFDIPDYQFNSDEKRLSFIISSSVSNNLAEIQIPKNLISGNFTFYLNDQEIPADVKTNEKISLITTKFPGKGLHKLDIIGTIYSSNTNDVFNNPELSETSGIDSVLLFTILGIIVAAGIGGVVFFKKAKNNHSLTKD